jgi:hypothetical protein
MRLAEKWDWKGLMEGKLEGERDHLKALKCKWRLLLKCIFNWGFLRQLGVGGNGFIWCRTGIIEGLLLTLALLSITTPKF